ADGAMARWRTLHEIAVTALFLQDGGDAVAARYIDHEVVESWRSAEKHRLYRDRLKEKSLSDKDFVRLEQRYQDLITKYKKPFAGPYGWASEKLNHHDKHKTTFADIEAAVNIDHLRPYYKLASHPVHANPKGICFKIGSFSSKGRVVVA